MPSFLALPSTNSLNIGLSATTTLVGSNGDPDVESSFANLEERDSADQLELLNHQLVLQNRIKEGAENLLNMPLDDSLREKVDTELASAKGRISAIERQIEAFLNSTTGKRKGTQGSTGPSIGNPNPNSSSSANGRSARDGRDGEEKNALDDSRTTLNNAINCIRELESLSRPPLPPSSSSTGSASLASSAANEADRKRIEVMSRLIDILQRNLRVRYELNISEVLQAVIPALADKCSKQCRAAAYRVIRHALVDAESVGKLGHAVDWYIIRSLHRDTKHAVEKEQVIKLIRTIVEVGTVRSDSPNTGGVVPLSEIVMRAVIAVAEHAEDPFRLICVQTLTEILLIDIDLVARTGGIRFLLHVLGEGPVEITPILASAFLHIVDSPRTRAYIRLGSDLEIALCGITDAYGKGPDHADRMRGCAKVVQMMLRTWSGLMYFCMNDMQAIRSLINTLTIPSLDTREIILDMFFELLNIKSSEWFQTFIDGRRLTMYRRSRDAPEHRKHQHQQQQDDNSERMNQTLKLTDQYLGLLVVILTNAGLCEALSSMLEETTTGSNLSRKATLLLAEVLQMSNRILPLNVAAKIQSIPEVFSMATDYQHGEHRIIGTSAISAIDSFNRNRARLEPSSAVKNPSRPRANSVEDAVRRGQRQVEQVKLKMSMQMDDRTFQACLLETQVMLTKDYTKWNFDTLQELIEGPLLNPKRMEEAIKVSRFIRRLMNFFHPFAHRFSDIPRKSNAKWVRLGCSLLTTLMSSTDGARYLSSDDQFLPQVVKSFAQLDPFNGVPDSDPIFSKKRVAETLTYGYMEMLGTLSKYKEGIELLEKFKVFTAFYHLSELRSREDLIKLIIDYLDYSIDGHPRIVLSKALTSSYKHIRLYATRHLGLLVRGATSVNAWTLRLLLTQLYDPAPEVCELAVHFLEEACDDKETLQVVVDMRPTMDHLGEIGHPLLLRFMSTPMGFRYLYDAGYIDREMDMWFNERNIYYVVQVEVFLAKVFNCANIAQEDDDVLAFEGTVPPHFYGEMSKTELGCQILQDKGHFSEFAEFIRRHSQESEDAELIMKLKSILWAVGNVGATEGGLPFLEEEEIIPAVLDIAENSPIPSVRGTCFFVLGLISSTSQGAEILDDFNWEATLSPLGTPTGLCLPMDVDKFISVRLYCCFSIEIKLTRREETRLIPPTTEPEIEVIAAIQNLANTVIQNTASRSLAKMKSRPEYRAAFSSLEMFYRALHIISTQRYRLTVRRYILELFNVELNPEVVTKLSEYATGLKASPTYKSPKTDAVARMSMFGRLGRNRRPSESDESDEEDDDQPILSLQPMSTTIGFAI
ncbi:Rapamycin-insensitive companion of mTOR, N-term-domain-containing protein [Crucibulum laeve]|uniref:Rapamycin-insensitive companion of mTOR, N-term-domain-containing protein n=1 Tax=Crucibulum laeve TaxID=68775 RepID=A0A5C3MAL6_9AGAR|nr:Rapamycin-insensitive companion of mTOR, N-term-domain-containing protein [Crucibulum laeve]